MKTAAAIVLIIAALLLAVAIASALAANAPSTASRVDVLVVEHAPAGAIERTGYLGAWRYTGSAMLLGYSPDGDALFHNGFEPPRAGAAP